MDDREHAVHRDGRLNVRRIGMVVAVLATLAIAAIVVTRVAAGNPRRTAPTTAAAASGARLVLLHNVSHFGLWQDPKAFNAAVLKFLDGPN